MKAGGTSRQLLLQRENDGNPGVEWQLVRMKQNLFSIKTHGKDRHQTPERMNTSFVYFSHIVFHVQHMGKPIRREDSALKKKILGFLEETDEVVKQKSLNLLEQRKHRQGDRY